MKERAQEALREKINAYLSANPSRSIPRLAKKASLAEMTVRRITQGECVASLETMMSLLKIVATEEETRSIVRDASPLLAEAIDKAWAWQKQTPVSAPSLNEAIKTQIGCYIVNLSSSRRGTTRTEIVAVLGKSGELALDKLIETGLLSETDNIIRNNTPEFSVTDGTTLIAQLRNLVDLYRFGNQFSCSTVQTESVNEEGLREIQRTLVDCANRIADIRQDPKFYGNIPFFFGALLNRFDTDNKN